MTSTTVERSRTRARRLMLSLSTILCSTLAAPAMATSAHAPLDANGVDMVDGSFNLRLPVASIGSGQSQLPLVVYGPLQDNWSRLELEQSVSGGVTTIIIHLGGTTYDTFSSADSFAASKLGTGARLTFGSGVVYSTLDGTAITFDNPYPNPNGGHSVFCDANNTNPCVLLPVLIEGRSGMTVNYSWDVVPNCEHVPLDEQHDCNEYWRLGSVSNDAGYSITWDYINPTGSPVSAWFQQKHAVFANSHDSSSTPTVTYAYPSSGVMTVTTPGGKAWRITGGSVGSISGVRRPSASSDTTTVSYVSGGSGVVSSVTRDGVTTGYSRSVSGSTGTIVVTDALSNATTVVADLTKQRVTQVTDPLSRVTTMSYDSVGRPTEVDRPEGDKVQYSYDTSGRLTTTTRVAKSGSGLSNIVTSLTYPTSCTAECNEPDTATDALGNVTNYSYDSTTGLVLTVTAPAPTTGATRPKTTYSYTASGSVSMLTGISRCQTGSSCVGTSDEVKTSISYNSNMLPSSVSTGAGDASLTATTAVTYDAVGNTLTVDGPLSGTADTTTVRWSDDREQLGVISPDPDGAGSMKRRAVKTTYNSDGQATVTEIGTVNGTTNTDWAAFVSLQQKTATYDANARKTLDTVTASSTTYNVTQYSYDGNGRLECTALRMNSATWGSLPSSACSLGTTGGYGADRISKITYDAAGQATKTQSAYGVTGVQADEATGTYNGNGTLATLTDAEGNETTYEYDGFDRLVKTRYPSTTAGAGTSSTTDYEQLVYDAGSEVTSRRLRDGNSIGYSYDHLGRLTAKDLPGSELDVAYSYDLLGRPTAAATSAQTLTFGYDALSRLTSQGGPLGTVVTQYDPAGRRTSLTWPDSFYVSYDHLVTGEVSAVRENGASSGIGVLATYTYDDLGRRTSLTRGNGTSSNFGYDNVSRLTSLGLNLDGSGTTNDLTLGFSYSPASQIAGTTRSNDGYAWGGAANRNDASSVNGLNQVTTVGAGSIGYDSKGNLNSTGSNSYTYSSENLLLTGPSSANLVYDPLLRLYQESGSSVATTLLQYDGQAMIGEYDSSAVMQRRYVVGPGADEPLVEYDKSGGSYTRVWLHADERGSIIAQSNDSGTTTAIDSYDEYGVPASGNTGRFGYTGQVWLPSLGTWYYKARMYAPRLGRFMQTDPIGYGDGPNWYNYTGGDPINATDPFGLDVEVDGDYGCISSEHHVKDVGCVVNGRSLALRAPSTTYDGDTGAVAGLDEDGCTAARKAAAALAASLEQASKTTGILSITFAAGALISGAGEILTLGADTPVTFTSGALSGYFGTASLATGILAAGLRTFANGGSPQAVANLTFNSLTELAGKSVVDHLGLGKYADLLGQLAGKGEELQNIEKNQCE